MNSDEINALLPTQEQNQDFMAMEFDGPIVMVNLLKFKADGGAAHYAKYQAIHHHREAGLEGQVNYAVAQIQAMMTPT